MSSPIARRYARALFEVAEEAQAVEVIGEQLAALVATLRAAPLFGELLLNPTFRLEQRHSAFDSVAEVLGLRDELRRAVKLLIDRRRTAELPKLAQFFREFADLKAGRARAQVWTAQPLTDELQAQLATALAAALHTQVTVEAQVDPALLGGAVTQVGSFLVDGSIRGRLRELRRELKRGGSPISTPALELPKS